jgi:hypothetical protein
MIRLQKLDIAHCYFCSKILQQEIHVSRLQVAELPIGVKQQSWCQASTQHGQTNTSAYPRTHTRFGASRKLPSGAADHRSVHPPRTPGRILAAHRRPATCGFSHGTWTGRTHAAALASGCRHLRRARPLAQPVRGQTCASQKHQSASSQKLSSLLESLLALPQLRLGSSPSLATSTRYARALTRSTARRLLICGRRISHQVSNLWIPALISGIFLLYLCQVAD